MNYSILFLFLLVTVSCKEQNTMASYPYKVAESKWDESFGNHRAILSIDSDQDVVSLDFEWRRSDKNVDKRYFLIINAVTGDTIPNILREKVTNEVCHLKFGPVKRGTYHFYYLPYIVQLNRGYYGGGYLPQEATADELWKKSIVDKKDISPALIKQVECRTAFDSFYPMGIIATSEEKANYKKAHRGRYWTFVEDRKYPIRMRTEIPYKWLIDDASQSFNGTASPNEYYTFQIGIWSGSEDIKDISYTISDLKKGNDVIASTSVTCFNIEGVDPQGNSFTKHINVKPNAVQPLWFGVDIADNQASGTYKGLLEIADESGERKQIPISLAVKGDQLKDRGDGESWRHSKLRWLNSTLGINDTPTVGYENMRVNDNTISCLGRSIKIKTETGLPESIQSWTHEILSEPMQFVIQTSKGIKNIKGISSLVEQNDGKVVGKWVGEDNDLSIICIAKMEFDGWINYIYTLNPKRDFTVEDIRLVISMENSHASYFMGMGQPGQNTPQKYIGKWDMVKSSVNNFGVSIPVNQMGGFVSPFDSFWIGSAKAGIHCELRGSTYSGPLLNLYRPAYPDSWYNNGNGGFQVEKKSTKTTATIYSGKRNLEKGKDLIFDFTLLITPVKPIDYKSQFTDRYFHNGGAAIPVVPNPTEEDLNAGVKIINLHHANTLNPFINYPFITADKIKDYTSYWHSRNCKVKIYYTIRELTNAVPEIWALRSLGDEILRDGGGGGFPWCREHLVTGYIPQWYQHLDAQDLGLAADASILTSTGASRWFNYYIEGLAWLVKNTDIDGLYLDDVSYGRDMLKRMRRAMDSVKSGCIIDLHSNTGFSRGPANQYAEFFPYIDKLWFGESFMYDNMSPSNWLVEVSGIPFGLMGDMLHRGGNKWLGMQYGMTVRYPWETDGVICDPRAIWNIWDSFGIKDAKMVGYWDAESPVTSTDSDLKISSYIKDGKTLLSIVNYGNKSKNAILNINWDKLGLDPSKTTIECPSIEDFQEEKQIKVGDEIYIEPKKGYLLILSEDIL